MKKTFTLLLMMISLLFSSTIHAQPFTVFASGFNQPIGITYDANGMLWVGEAGTGANDSKISMITPSAIVYTVVTDLPSFVDTNHETSGAWRAEMLGSILMVLVGPGPDTNAGTIMFFDVSHFVPGTSSPFTPADADSILHVSDWVLHAGFAESDPYSACFDDKNNIYIADAAANAVIKYTTATQTFSVLDTFPATPNQGGPFPPFFEYVPTRIINGPITPGGSPGFYLGNLGAFGPGLGEVVLLDSNGVVTSVDSGYNSIVDIQYDSVAMERYILQFGDFDSSFNPISGSAKIFRVDQSGHPSLTCTGFGPSPGLAMDGLGGGYVTELMTGNVLHFSDITGIKDPVRPEGYAMNTFPNPFNNSVDIHVDLRMNTSAQLDIKDVTGKIVYTKFVQLIKGDNKFTWDGKSNTGNELSSGNYIISVIAPNASTSSKVLKQ